MGVRAGTYSIVARDTESGELGVAVQSHWFSVGSIVTWARAGVGAVATQSIAEPGYGPKLLDRLAAGEDVVDALSAELAGDELARFRQLAVVDASGAVATHTGDGCMDHAGHEAGEGFSAQANLMASPAVWPAMASGVRLCVRSVVAAIARRARGRGGSRWRRSRPPVGGAAGGSRRG